MRPRPLGRGNACWRRSPSPDRRGRFNEAAAVGPRKRRPTRLPDHCPHIASMRPRPLGRGNCSTGSIPARRRMPGFNEAAAVGPRKRSAPTPPSRPSCCFNEAAAVGPRKQIYCSSAQRKPNGRCFNEAAAVGPRKRCVCLIGITFFIDASMRPRPLGRGNSAKARSQSRSRCCFNEAAAVGPRKPSVFVWSFPFPYAGFNEAAAVGPRKQALRICQRSPMTKLQ